MNSNISYKTSASHHRVLSLSVAGLPYLLKDGVEKANVDPRIADFVAPIAVTINRDGSGLFVSVGSIFILQTYGVDLRGSDYFILM